ncbi:hypothetical protein CHF27_013280, partial [Romboutsia maritimum]
MKKQNRFIKSIISLVVSISMFLGSMPIAFAQKTVNSSTSVEQAINATGAFMCKEIPEPGFGTTSGEWTILSLARAGYKVPENYYKSYYKKVCDVVKEKNGVLDNIKYTEYSRLIVALTSLGMNPTDVGGYDLIKPLSDFDKVKKQGINGPIWALIALDTNNYEIPKADEGKNQSTRDNLVKYILDKEIKGGGWALFGNKADPDITAMALQALAKYKDSTVIDEKGNKIEVKPYIDRAIDVLSKMQLDNGGYNSWGTENSESIAQVIVALTALEVDPAKDSRFIKNNNWTIPAIMQFYVEGGGFKHTLSTDVNGMATDQSMYALVAYDRFVKGKNRLYDMSDATKLIDNKIKLEKINFDRLSVTIGEGKTDKLIVSYYPEDTTDDKKVNWTIADESIAKVDKNGKIIGIKEGNTKIKAKVGQVEKTAELIVNKKPIIEKRIDVREKIEKISENIYKNNQNNSQFSKWNILQLARGGVSVPKNYYENYYENVVKELKEGNGKIKDFSCMDYLQLILEVTSIGKDATNVGGYNLLTHAVDVARFLKEEENLETYSLIGSTMALKASDSNRYILTGKFREETEYDEYEYKCDEYRHEYLGDFIRCYNHKLHGFRNRSVTKIPDSEAAAIVLQAQTKYNISSMGQRQQKRAINCLSKEQKKDGSFDSILVSKCECTAEVVIALIEAGIDPLNDPRFVKEDGKSALSALMEFYVEDGGFKNPEDKEINLKATELGMSALVAYDRFNNNKNSLYNMTDGFEPVYLPVKLESINLDKEKMTIEEGNKEDLKVKYNPEDTTEDKTVTWTSSDEKIAKVDKNGKVTGIKEGKAIITAKVGDKTVTCEVTVKAISKPSKPSSSGGSSHSGGNSSSSVAVDTKKIVGNTRYETAIKVSKEGWNKA